MRGKRSISFCGKLHFNLFFFQVRIPTVRVLCYTRAHTTSRSSSRYLPTSRRPLRANMAVCDTLWGWPFVHLEVPIRHARVNSEFKGHLTWMQNQILQWVYLSLCTVITNVLAARKSFFQNFKVVCLHEEKKIHMFLSENQGFHVINIRSL